MCQYQESLHSHQVSRRHFIHASGGMASLVLLGACVKPADESTSTPPLAQEGAVRPLSRVARDAMTPDDVIAMVMRGNERFRSGQKKQRDLLTEMRETADGQNPMAVLLSCIDSRAPAEIIFDLGLGDIFNCRIAGNVESPDMLGSLEFATKLAGAKLVMALGHSACGAVRGAIAGAELGHLTGLLAKFRPAIEATDYEGERSASNAEYVDAVARKNVALTVRRIRERSTIIAEQEKEDSLKVVGGFYNLATGEVELIG